MRETSGSWIEIKKIRDGNKKVRMSYIHLRSYYIIKSILLFSF